MESSKIQKAVSSIVTTLEAVGIIERWYYHLQLPAELKGEVDIDLEEFESAKDFIASHFNITHQQAIFLIAIFIICNDTDTEYGSNIEANFRQIARKLNMVTSEMFKYIRDFDELIKKRILSTDDEINKTHQSLKITPYVSDCLLLNTPYIEEENKGISNRLSDYLKKQKNYITKCSRRSFPSDRLIGYIEGNYSNLSNQFPLVRYINELNISTYEKILFFETCGSTTFQDGKIKVLELAEILFNNMAHKKQFLRNLSTGGSLLVKEDLLDIESGEFLSDLEVTLSEKAL